MRRCATANLSANAGTGPPAQAESLLKQEVESNRSQIEVREPQLFSHTAVAILNCFAMLLIVPLLLAFGAVVLLVKIQPPSIVMTVLVLHLALAITIYFLPFWLGNPYVTYLVRLFERAPPTKRRRFIVQVTFDPRLRTGLRGLAEDADDIGVLTFDDADLVFEGDSITIRLPLNQVSGLKLKNIGWRGLWLASERVTISIVNVPGVNSLEICERFSWTIRKSRRITQELYQLLEFQMQRHG